ncbi:DUF756 domain-containing protein [archaeon]|nr:MAG: DUF756 domain-containing protein [archaeon]
MIERRFNVSTGNISPWRRLVTGDLVSFFDFSRPDYTTPRDLPDTSKYVEEGDVECHTLPDPLIPAEQTRPEQEQGTRISRALPYELHVSSVVEGLSLLLTLENSGSEGLALSLFDLLSLQDPSIVPRQYALAPGATFTDTLTLGTDGRYAYALHGPNGFLRELRGNGIQCVYLEAALSLDPAHDQVSVRLVNQHPTESAGFFIQDNAYGLLSPRTVTIAPLSSGSVLVNTASVGNWYDFTVSSPPLQSGGQDTDCLRRRLMGRMETGKDTISDPAMGAHLPTWLDASPSSQPPPPSLPERVRRVKRVEGGGGGKDARFYPKQEL